MKTFVAVAIGVLALPPTVLAQDRQPDVLFVTGATQSGSGANGAEGDLQWLRSGTPGTTMMVGGTVSSISDLWWTYGTLSGSVRRREATYAGRISIGAGRWVQNPFAYERYVGETTIPVARGLFVKAEAQHVRLAGITATVFQFGTIYATPSGVSVALAYYHAPWDRTPTRGLSARGDVTVGRFTVMGGVVATARQPASTEIQALSITSHIAPEYFGGCTLPAGGSSLIVSAQLVPQPSGRLVRISATVKHPFGPRNGRGQRQL
jgi:hypothetical protein